MQGDLHIHTRLSDGSAGMEQVVSGAKIAGINCIAITDHDSINSFPRSKIIGQRYGVHIIEGVELSAFDTKRKRKVHILCYCPKKPDRLAAICNTTQLRRRQAGQQMAKNVMLKYPISPERITKYSSGSQCIYKQHLMQALMDSGHTLSIYGELYDKLFGSNEQSCAVTIDYPSVREVLQQVHSARGFAVLAHPRVYDSFELLNELIEENLLDGIEVWHPKNEEGDSEQLLQLALNNNLLPIGGSDFHGMYNSIVAYIGKCYTPKKYLDVLLDFERKK